jgi:Zn-dependent protease
MWINDLAQALTYFLAMLLALTFHEAAHAYVAHIRGDDTALSQGRLSLNPAAHADLVGTIILPLVGFLMRMPIIGWAKPVPVNERNFKKPVFDSFLVGMAGPFSNLMMALISVIVFRAYNVYGQDFLTEGSFFYPVIKLLIAFAIVNATLAFFNLIPFPPLDGASLLRVLLPRQTYDAFESTVAPYGFIILLVLAMSGGLTWVSHLARLYMRVCEMASALIIPAV